MIAASSDPIGSATIDLIHPDGRRVPGRIWIGLPYTVDEHEARCPCGLDGIDGRLPDISGNDTLQALMLAARLLADRLADFKERTGLGDDEAHCVINVSDMRAQISKSSECS